MTFRIKSTSIFWTSKQNYFIRQKGLFTIPLTFARREIVSSILFEHDEMLVELIDFAFSESYDNRVPPSLVSFKVEDKVIVILQDNDYDQEFVFGQMQTDKKPNKV